jgi:hypothetical protein
MSVVAEKKTILVVPNAFEFQLAETANGFDYYAIWDVMTGWSDEFVRVIAGADDQAVLDAFHRNDMVTSL